MGLNLGAFLPALAQGVGAYSQGHQRGEDERYRRETEQRKLMFDEYARKRQLNQTDDRVAAQQEMAAEKLRNLLQLRAMQDDAAGKRVETQQAGENTRTGVRYGPGGQGDRDNIVKQTIGGDKNQTALDVARIKAAASAASGGVSQGLRQGRAEDKARADYLKETAKFGEDVKAFVGIKDYATHPQVSGQTGQAGDLAFINTLSSVLQPKSGLGVRIGQMQMEKNAQSLAQKLDVLRAQLTTANGALLAPSTKQAYLNEVNNVLRARTATLKPVIDAYRKKAQQRGFDSEWVAPDPYEAVGGIDAWMGAPPAAMPPANGTAMPAQKPPLPWLVKKPGMP